MKAIALAAVFLVGCDGGAWIGSGGGGETGPAQTVVVITEPQDKVIAPAGNPDLIGVQDLQDSESSDGNVISSNDVSNNSTEAQ